MNHTDKIYVAGHRGLVGSAIWKCLTAHGYHNLVGRTHAELDLMDSAAVRRFFDDERPDVVVLAAAKVGGIMANSMFPADFIYENLQIQQNVIGEAFRHDVGKLLFLGSTCIYPRMAPQPMVEGSLLTSSLEPTNEPYALAKITGLKMCHAFNRQYGTNYIAVMPTNFYGPGDNFDPVTSHVLPAIMGKIINARHSGASEVTLWGTGKPLREFLWSGDMADACLFMLENVDADDADLVSRNSNHRIENTNFVNVGTGIEHTIADVAHMVADVVGYTGEIRFDSSYPDGTPRKLTDVSHIHAMGWHHSVDLADGIRLLYQWLQSNNKKS